MTCAHACGTREHRPVEHPAEGGGGVEDERFQKRLPSSIRSLIVVPLGSFMRDLGERVEDSCKLRLLLEVTPDEAGAFLAPAGDDDLFPLRGALDQFGELLLRFKYPNCH